jgi:GTPase
LEKYNLRLTERPQIIVANKMDMPEAEDNLIAFKEKLGDEDALIFPISAITRKGLDELLFAVADLLEVTPEFPMHEIKDEEEHSVLYKHESEVDFEVTRDDDGAFVLSGYTIERLFRMTDFNFDQSVRKFARQMRGMGVDDALRERGAKDGDTVRLLEFEFEFLE